MVPTIHAETRWCSITGRDSSDKFNYPPIAKAARVWGMVLAHMIYAPNGTVERVEAISGPPMLRTQLSDQLMKWTVVKTDAHGEELCETLVIANFELHDSTNPSIDKPLPPDGPSILRLSANDEWFIISDPAADLQQSWKAPFRRFGYALRRRITRAFGHHG
jgi:hypothetical protein